MSNLYTLEEFLQEKRDLEEYIADTLKNLAEKFGVPVTSICANIESYGASYGKPNGEHIIRNVHIDVDI